MALHIHRAERADLLAHQLGEVLRAPLSDPFATEVVAVPTQGVERWLAQTLAHQLGTSVEGRDGICAGVDFSSPGRVTGRAVALASGISAADDPWLPRYATWTLLDVIDSSRADAWAELLRSYLNGHQTLPTSVDGKRDIAAAPGRRWSTAAHLAQLFAHYASSRPEMILRWLQGDNVDGVGRPLAADYAWQAELWRRLRAELATPSPAERTAAACARLVAEPHLVDLPTRLSLFGPTRLAPEQRLVFVALAEHREVHLWLPHPSPRLWQRLADFGVPAGLAPRSSDQTAGLPANPLLGYLGRDSRELQLTLKALPTSVTDDHHGSPSAGRQRRSLLQQLQADLAGDRATRPEGERPLLDPADRSVSAHACHGPDRQVEVLRDLLVGLLADDPTLQPRDIVVMCPDIERFAPLISASFGLWADGEPSGHPGHGLRVRLADRALRQVNPLLAVLSRVLELADSRLEAPTLLDLCASAPVARKFAFSDEELERLGDLVLRSGVRWGLDADHRRDFAMGQFRQNTWAAGLDRLLLGVTMDESEQQFIGTTLPLDDVDSADVDLVGRLAELVDRVRGVMQQLGSPRPLTAWIQLCQQTLEQLTAVSAAEQWQLTSAYAELASLSPPDGEQPQTELGVGDVTALLSDSFRGRATRANFRTGTLTMCTMLPMRSVPHRVVCLLGIDDGVFPRPSAVDGDDILAGDPFVGDRDPRSEDRQLLLDAVMAAQEQLILIYSGIDARTGVDRPPAVPVGALLDALDLTARPPTGRVRDQILIRHRLQPFDNTNFVPGALTGRDSPAFSFDRGALRGALAASCPRRPARRGLDPLRFDLPALPQILALPDLVRFFQHPVKALLRYRAGLVAARGDEGDEGDEQIPVLLKPLESWAVGDRLLRQHLDGTPIDQLTAAEWRRGVLPPQVFGTRALTTIVDNVHTVVNAVQPFLTEAVSSVDALAELSTCTVAGTLSPIHGDCLVSVSYSWLGPRHRLQAWLELLALTVTHPDRDWQAVTVGRGRPSLLGPVPAPWATKVLQDLVDLYRTGLAEPLALAPKTAAEYARLRSDGKSIDVFSDKLERLWAEERDASYERVLGPGVRFSALLETPSVTAEERGSLAEPSRFGTLARRVWHPLLESEVWL